MKKISAITLLSVLTMPAFAEDNVPSPIIDSVAQDIAEKISEPISHEEVVAEDTVATTKSETAFPHGVQIGVGLSATSGLNGFVGYANKDFDSFWAKRFGVRFDFASTKPVKSLINNGIDSIMGDDGIDVGDNLTIADGQIEAQHYAALVDFYPFGDTWMLGGWRITGGYAFGDMNMMANVAGAIDGPTGYYEFELGDTKYAYTGNTVHGTAEMDWEYRGPYVGTGFDIGLFAGFKIYVDAGVVFTNRAAELSLSVPTDNLKQWNGSDWAAVDLPELDKVIDETLADARSELDDFKFYPMVKMGFMYRF